MGRMKRLARILLLIPFLLLVHEANGEDGFFPEEELPEWLVGERIVQIAFQGNMRIGEGELIEEMRTKKGDLFSTRRLREDVKRLYKTGYFDDIKVDAEREWGGGLRLTFILKERPIVSSLQFEGNKKIKEKELLSCLSLKEEDFYSPIRGREGCREIIKLYHERGYYFASVGVDTTLDEDANTVEVKFRIEEGKVVRIKRINLEGNTAISSLRLSWYMETKRGGHYIDEVLRADIEKIRLLYVDRGYLLVKVREPEVKYDARMKGLVVTIKIDEGPLFRVGKISFSGNTLFSSTRLKEVIKTRSGDVYSLKRFQGDLIGIQDLYGQKGYIAAKIVPTPSLDYSTKKIDIHLEIHEGEKYYLEEVQIQGNGVTKDNVIRREILLVPGEIFDGRKLKLSRQRLFNLGYFEEVNTEILPGTTKDRKILLISVKERKTGIATFGAGYSSREGLIGNIQVSQTNLFGRGWKVRLSTNFGGKTTNYNFGFINPWVFDTPTSFGFNLYDTRRDRDTYLEARRGGDIRLGFRMGLYNRLSITHRRDIVETLNVEEDAPEDVEEGLEATNSLSFTLRRDTTDNPIFPTQGYNIEVKNEFAGGRVLGGDIDFYKPRIRGGIHLPLIWRSVLSLKGRWSKITNPFSEKEIPDYEKFYLGGSGSIRGYRDLTIHPYDEEGNDVGGEGMVVANIEIGIPLAEDTLRAYLFFDAGNSWLKPEEVALDDLKCGAGIGVLFRSPLGPIRLDYGYPIADPENRDPQFHFGIGPIF
jgi:outer membrane protein insertion porin family